MLQTVGSGGAGGPGGAGEAGGDSPEVLRCIPADKEYLIFLFHSCQLPTVAFWTGLGLAFLSAVSKPLKVVQPAAAAAAVAFAFPVAAVLLLFMLLLLLLLLLVLLLLLLCCCRLQLAWTWSNSTPSRAGVVAFLQARYR